MIYKKVLLAQACNKHNNINFIKIRIYKKKESHERNLEKIGKPSIVCKYFSKPPQIFYPTLFNNHSESFFFQDIEKAHYLSTYTIQCSWENERQSQQEKEKDGKGCQ